MGEDNGVDEDGDRVLIRAQVEIACSSVLRMTRGNIKPVFCIDAHEEATLFRVIVLRWSIAWGGPHFTRRVADVECFHVGDGHGRG